MIFLSKESKPILNDDSEAKSYEQLHAKIISNLITQTGFRLVKFYGRPINAIGISPEQVSVMAHLVMADIITVKTAHLAFELVCKVERARQ
ncbi:hypothetical protein LCGC14_1968470 [marine sediment metagenome]|uniref:Uncharacterized protein n=1 Tax=marine sediment metagenome TaxID=412755 RepID=A0A0F9I9E7_9ZZZZ